MAVQIKSFRKEKLVSYDFSKAYEHDNFETIGLLLANWLIVNNRQKVDVISLLKDSKTVDGKKLLAMVNSIMCDKKSDIKLDKFQKKAEDYPLTEEEIKLICSDNTFKEISDKLMEERSPKWLMGWRNV